MIDVLRRWWQRRKLYVLCDGNDNSVTLSKELFREMGGHKMDCDSVIVFRAGDRYAFTNEHNIPEDGKTAMSKIQVNSKYKCIGFECAVPGLNRIFYDYGLPAGIRVKLSVDIRYVFPDHRPMKYYEIVPPSKTFLKHL